MLLHITARISGAIHSTQVNPSFVTLANVFGDSWKNGFKGTLLWGNILMYGKGHNVLQSIGGVTWQSTFIQVL